MPHGCPVVSVVLLAAFRQKKLLTKPLHFATLMEQSCRVSSSGRATASQAVGGGFESRILLQKIALQRVVKNTLGRFAF